MEFIYTFMRQRSIKAQLITYFITLILLAIIVLVSIGNFLYSNAVKKEVNVYTQQVINQIKTDIDFYIGNMEDITYYLSKDPQIIKFLKYDGTGNVDMDDLMKNAKKVLSVYENSNSEIAGIMLVNENDMEISNNMVRISREPLIYEKWYSLSKYYPYEIHLFSKPIGRNLKGRTNYSADDVVSISKAIKDENTGHVLGVVLIDMKLDIIKKVIENGKIGKTGFVYIMDSNGNIVYSPANPVVYRIKAAWINKLDKTTRLIKNENYQILKNYSNYTKWNTIGVFSLKENQKVVSIIKIYTIITAFGILFLGIIAALVFSSTIANPIKKLRKLMKKAEEGDLSVRFETKYNDEIGQLGNSFNNMIEKIKNLINLVYVEQKRKREAELKILESQIKPHFLYNTLDTIQWMAQEYDADDIVEVIDALTNLFRIGLNKGKEIVQLQDEITHTRSYLTIQLTRYEDKFDYDIHVEEGVLNYSVVKIILQPIIENAIYHGIKPKSGKGHIYIKAYEKNKNLYLTVADDGVGMMPEKLKQLNDILSGKKESLQDSGYGIFNVNERIKITYGNKYGLRIYSEIDKGTTVEIKHPILN